MKLSNSQETSKNKSKTVPFLFIASIAVLCLFIYFIYSLNPISSLNFQKNEPEIKPIIVNHYRSPYHSNNILDNLFYPYKSDIMENIDEFEFLRDSLGKVNLVMLFNSNIHGDYAKDFHKLTNKNNVLLLIKTKKGNRFGGYTSLNYSPVSAGLTSYSIDIVKNDESAFLFNLDSKKVFEVADAENAVACDDYSTAIFGESDLVIPNYFLSNSATSAFPKSYRAEGAEGGKNELTGGEAVFKIESIEAYQVNFYTEFGDEKNRMGEESVFDGDNY